MSGSKILVIDDAAEMLKITAAILRKGGHQVQIASTAEEALSSLQTLRPDAILVDIRLPGLGGLGFTRRVRQDPQIQDTVVLAMTAFSGLDVEREAREAGCDGFITKPFDANILTAFVRGHLDPQIDPPVSSAVDPPTKTEQPRAFLDDACSQCKALAASLDSSFQASKVTPVLRRLAEDAAYYGYTSIPPLAHETAELVDGLFWDRPQLKNSMNKLVTALLDLKVEAEAALSPALTKVLQPTILIVDDDVSIRRLLQVALQNLGMKCLVAEDGEEAGQLLVGCQPDVAIIDVNLPTMDGFEVIGLIRAHAPEVRIILLTGREAESDILRGFQLGANDYVTKPFNQKELIARLKRLLSVRNIS